MSCIRPAAPWGRDDEHQPLTLPTRVALCLMAGAGCELCKAPLQSTGLTALSLLLLALCSRADLALMMLRWSVTTLGLFLFSLKLPLMIFSPPLLWGMLMHLPVLIMFALLVTSPPGLISSGLCKMGAPKKVIFGLLTALRFFPTFAHHWRLLRESGHKRRTGPGWFIAHPVLAFEQVLAPLAIALIDSAEQLAASAVTRAAEAPGKSTSYYRVIPEIWDWAVPLLYLAGAFALRALMPGGVK